MPEARSAKREIELVGGVSNRGLVVRVDDTVRRPTSPGSTAVHDLLRHLEAVGFDGAPRFLGVDDDGREVLTYVEGDVAVPPYPAWALTDDALVSVARLLRRYHEAVRCFDPAGYAWATDVPPEYRRDLVSHNDPNLDNVVFRDGEAVALIDFDLASPGSALWDLAIAARLWVPLRDPRDGPAQLAGRAGERLRVLLDAYGVPAPERGSVVHAARRTHDWCYDVMRSGAERGQPGYVRVWTPEKRAHVARGRRWLATSADGLAAEVTSAGGA